MTDLRVLKTQKAIQNALIDLLQIKPFEKITVQDFVETALINRSTFYDHYSGKSDLVGKLIKNFKLEYQNLIKTRLQSTNLEQFAQEAITFLYPKKTAFACTMESENQTPPSIR